MKPYELIAALVEREGGTLPAAKAMKKPTFQGTLHKICHGGVVSPSRSSAERIANHYKIPVDAIYDEKLAEQIFRERFPEGSVKMISEIAYPAPDKPEPPHQDQFMLFANSRPGKSKAIVDFFSNLGSLLKECDPISRAAIKPMLEMLADDPTKGEEIGRRIAGLLEKQDEAVRIEHKTRSKHGAA